MDEYLPVNSSYA